MAGIQEYKCPCCGGAIEFNSTVQKMKCPYCDTEFEMSALADYAGETVTDGQDDMDYDTDSIREWQEGEEAGMRVYVCQSCGGEIVTDENTVASSCPYCDNPIVVKGSVKGSLKPEYIIPFKLDKAAAKARYYDHLKGKKLLPPVFKSQNHIEEIKGVYIPYWIFDSRADAHIRYRATRVRAWSDSKHNYVETSYFAVIRGGKISFEHVPVDGASKIDNDITESLEPYDFSEAKAFNQAYMAGYMADKYDVDRDTSINRANERVKNSTQAEFRKTVNGYASVVYEGGNIKLDEGKASYVMYPAWLMTTKWNGQTYTFAMNGQTGKFVGNLPVDKSIQKTIFIKWTAIAAAIAFAVQALFYFIF